MQDLRVTQYRGPFERKIIQICKYKPRCLGLGFSKAKSRRTWGQLGDVGSDPISTARSEVAIGKGEKDKKGGIGNRLTTLSNWGSALL